MNDIVTRTNTTPDAQLSERAQLWASTMGGNDSGDIVTAHSDSHAGCGTLIEREQQEDAVEAVLCANATRARGAGNRAREEEPDRWRTCFDKDRDRILHSSAFRRLAGKTQVLIFPGDHQRTRLTHALEVAQIARAIATAVGANATLAEAIGLGHDCGHGPGGHASEDAFDHYIAGGYNHAVWGADVTLAKLNLCDETLDGIRSHSWSLPAPKTIEGEIVSWADRIAYVAHDFEDAVSAGIVAADSLPAEVADWAGISRSTQIDRFVNAIIDAAATSGQIGMGAEGAGVLAAFRRHNYERIYTRPTSEKQNELVIGMLRSLVDTFIDRPHILPEDHQPADFADSDQVVRAAVAYVAGMTDRFACSEAVRLGAWDSRHLPRGI